MKRKIILCLGERDGWGKAAHVSGYSHLVGLECGHRVFVPNSRYKGAGSLVWCRDCEKENGENTNGNWQTK